VGHRTLGTALFSGMLGVTLIDRRRANGVSANLAFVGRQRLLDTAVLAFHH
jgi:hypothetical protein